MRARWFLLIGIAIGALIAVGRILTTRGKAAAAQPTVVVGTKLFEDVFSHVRDFAVDSLDSQELYRRAAAGVIPELDDPYAFLILPGQRVPSPDSASAQGLYLDQRDGAAVVVATVPGSAADSAGVRKGDILLSIDSVALDPSHLDRAVRRLEGEPGSPVTLRLRRNGVRGLLALDVIRKPLPSLAPLTGSVLSGNVGYLKIHRMVPSIADSVRQEVDRLRQEGARSLVLDLRSVVGGSLQDGAALADLFLASHDTLAVSRGRPGASSLTYADSTASPFDSIPMAVLVDAGTAGAPEVVAGALQDHDRAAIMGGTTFGRGVTQSTFPLGGGASIRLTTSLWMTPSGRQIQRPPRAGADSVPRPKARSDAGRALEGGGGIVPDRLIADTGVTDLALAEARRLLLKAGSVRAVLGLKAEH